MSQGERTSHWKLGHLNVRLHVETRGVKGATWRQRYDIHTTSTIIGAKTIPKTIQPQRHRDDDTSTSRTCLATLSLTQSSTKTVSLFFSTCYPDATTECEYPLLPLLCLPATSSASSKISPLIRMLTGGQEIEDSGVVCVLLYEGGGTRAVTVDSIYRECGAHVVT